MALLAQATSELNQAVARVQSIGSSALNTYSSQLLFFDVVSLLLTFLFIAGTVYFMVYTNWIQLRIDRVRDVVMRTNLHKKRIVRGWQAVRRHFYSGSDNDLKVALMEADKLLDDTLKAAGFRGESLGDRLKTIDESQLPNIQEIWEAHKLRNRLVHEPDFKLKRDIAEKALGIYKRTLRDLGVLE